MLSKGMSEGGEIFRGKRFLDSVASMRMRVDACSFCAVFITFGLQDESASDYEVEYRHVRLVSTRNGHTTHTNIRGAGTAFKYRIIMYRLRNHGKQAVFMTKQVSYISVTGAQVQAVHPVATEACFSLFAAHYSA